LADAFDRTGGAGGGRAPPPRVGAEPPPLPPPKPTPYKGQMARANVALALLFIAGVGAIYGFSLRNGPAEASAEQQMAEAQVDSAIIRLSAAPDPRTTRKAAGSVTRELLRNFCAEIRDRQIPPRELNKDPFVFVRPPKQVLGPVARQPASAPAPEAADPAEETLADATEKFKDLKLQSIMKGRGGRATAIISNNLLTAGQQVSVFTVKSIGSKTVVLAWKAQEFTLEMP